MKIKSSIVACILGTILEWYDFAIFGALTPVLAKLFFPDSSSFMGLLSVFSIFAIGFLIRPLGAIILGHFGDRKGRKRVLTASVFVMTVSTVGIGLLPTYTTIGVVAPLLLLTMRLFQGFSVGGEYSGVITYISELTKDNKNTFFSSFSVFGVVGGLLVGTLTAALLTHYTSESFMLSFGWRLPFLAGVFLGAAGLFLRRRGAESIEFYVAKKAGLILAKPVMNLAREQHKNIILVVLLFWPIVLATYLLFIYMPTKVYYFAKIPLSSMLSMNAANMLVLMLAIPLFGMLAEKVGQRIVITIGLALMVLVCLPLFYLFEVSYWHMFFSQLLLAIVIAVSVAPMPAFAANIFPTNVRFSGVSVGLNLAAAFFGGTAPVIGVVLEQLTKSFLAPAVYLMLAATIALLGVNRQNIVCFMRKKSIA